MSIVNGKFQITTTKQKKITYSLLFDAKQRNTF